MEENQRRDGLASTGDDIDKKPIILQAAASGDKVVAVVGSQPELPVDFIWPQDKIGEPMRFVAQIDFAALASTVLAGAVSAEKNGAEKLAAKPAAAFAALPAGGLLSLFCAAQIATMSPKDRKAFHIAYLPQAALDQTLSASNRWTVRDDTARLDLGPEANFLLCQDTGGLEQQKEIAAFAASGISHSAARAADGHYSHLMAEVPNWILLAQLGGMRLLTRLDDLEARRFERAWLMVATL
ncbi:MAG: DUF1963 domain-containing protein [Cyanobacteria bacterium REEB67]|nr:DUF1963 domain-containing protein [Cyanobacteria bacterium REEB67]